MKRRAYPLASIFILPILILGICSPAQTSLQSVFYERLTRGDSADWSFETSGPLETITATSVGWICQAGGNKTSNPFRQNQI